MEPIEITAKQAAQILGRSPSAISRALASGRLEYCDPQRKLLARHGLEQRFANCTRPKADVRQVAKPGIRTADRVVLSPQLPSPPAFPVTYWDRAAQKLAVVLDGAPAYWAEAPDGDRLKLFCQSLDLIRQQCADEGLKSAT